MIEPIVEVKDLVKRYKKADANAVDGISFSLARGEFFTLLGPNGAGKTTTLSILTTTLTPTSGSVRVAGHDLTQDPGAVRRHIGIIFQRPSLDLNLTAEENIRFHAVLYGLYPFRPTFSTMPPEYKRQVRELASMLDIERDINRPVKTFSGGMRRKLEIVRSLMHRPLVLFLDEPTSGLDAASRRSLWSHLTQLRRESGTTIFLTTHYLEEAEQADTICILNRGRVVCLGTPDEVKAHLVESYLLLDASTADRPALQAELSGLGLAFSDAPPFRVGLDGHSAHAIVKSIHTPLTVLKTHMPSLEEAYLDIVERAA
jgi:ABC-2 type transport system ATP-binding protein